MLLLLFLNVSNGEELIVDAISVLLGFVQVLEFPDIVPEYPVTDVVELPEYPAELDWVLFCAHPSRMLVDILL